MYVAPVATRTSTGNNTIDLDLALDVNTDVDIDIDAIPHDRSDPFFSLGRRLDYSTVPCDWLDGCIRYRYRSDTECTVDKSFRLI